MARKRLYDLTEDTTPSAGDYLITDKSGLVEATKVNVNKFLLASGAFAGAASQAQEFGASGVTIAYDGSNKTTLVTDSSGNLTITPSGRGATTKVLHVGDTGVAGSNTEILSVYHSYTTAEIATNPNMFEGHAKWIGDADSPTYTMRAGYLMAQGWSSKSIKNLIGLVTNAETWAATPVVSGVYGLSATASTHTAGSSAPEGIGVTGAAGTLAGTLTTAIGAQGWAYVPGAAGASTTAMGVQGKLSSLGGSVATAIGIQSELVSSAGTITNYYGFKLESLPAATPTVTNAYGLHLPAITLGGTLNYAIHAAGGQNYFGGNVGIGTASPGTQVHALLTSATTNAIVNVLTLGAAVTGAGVGANGLGPGILFQAESATDTTIRNQARLASLWYEATDATFKADLVGYASDAAGEREGWRVRANGSAPALGLYGVAPVARATTGIAPVAFVQGTGNAVNDASTFGGYTLLQVVAALQAIGVLT